MANTRAKDFDWQLHRGENGWNWEQVHTAVLMDIRDELKALNRIIGCPNAIDIPNILRRIDKNTKKRPRKKAKATI